MDYLLVMARSSADVYQVEVVLKASLLAFSATVAIPMVGLGKSPGTSLSMAVPACVELPVVSSFALGGAIDSSLRDTKIRHYDEETLQVGQVRGEQPCRNIKHDAGHPFNAVPQIRHH